MKTTERLTCVDLCYDIGRDPRGDASLSCVVEGVLYGTYNPLQTNSRRHPTAPQSVEGQFSPHVAPRYTTAPHYAGTPILRQRNDPPHGHRQHWSHLGCVLGGPLHNPFIRTHSGGSKGAF